MQNSYCMGQAPFAVRYEVFITNADLEQIKLVYQGFDRDMAETKMMLLSWASGYGTDFMMLNTTGMVFESACFTTKTASLRNECQG